ncbi:MAG: hypothetical protein ACFFD2_10600 [Promethearchaeota archaeon]
MSFIIYLLVIPAILYLMPFAAAVTAVLLFGKKKKGAGRPIETPGWQKALYVVFVFLYLIMGIIFCAWGVSTIKQRQ